VDNGESRDFPEHVISHRQNERKPEIPFHSTDRNSNQATLLIQDAATRHTGVSVGQTRDETIRCSLPDVTGGQDDSL
jgi:hypothetical protein